MAKLNVVPSIIYHHWTTEETNDIQENYSYYINHHEEAEEHFQRKWISIALKASLLDVTGAYLLWTTEEINDLKEKYPYYNEHIKEAEQYFRRTWKAISVKASKLGIESVLMKTNKKCTQFLGIHVAERVLSHVFKDVHRMPYGNPGYDFTCNKGFKIDSKASCLCNDDNTYAFIINCNKITDYFLLIGFDNREDLNPQHVWLIKSDEIIRKRKLNEFQSLKISNTRFGLSQFLKHEHKLKEIINCCNVIKNNNQK